MANTDGLIQVFTQIKPTEIIAASNVSVKGAGFVDVYIKSTECAGKDLVYTTDSIEYKETGAASDGYLNGERYLVEVTTTSAATITSAYNVEWVYFKHTGFRYNEFTDATCDTDHSAGSGTAFGSNPKIIQMDSTTLVPVGATVSGTGIAAGSVVTQIDSSTLFRVDIDTIATNADQTLTFSDHLNPSTTASVDYLEIRGDSASGWIVAVLAPGEHVCLPVHCTSGRAGAWGVSNVVIGSGFFFQSIDIADLTAGGNNIAMEFICVTAS